MKHVFTPLIVLLLGINCLAQPLSFSEKVKWDTPQFSQSFILRNDIKAIHVKSFEGKIEPAGNFSSGVSYEYDSRGNLIQVVEVSSKDTSRVYDYKYTASGVLGWQHLKDNVWNKSYKSGYRFNSHKKVFQVKSYEMLHNNEVMLLHTKEYVYDDDSTLIAVRWMENSRVVKINRYEYEKGNLKSETFENGNGSLVKKIIYDYNSDGLIAKVTTKQELNSLGEQYVYDYNTRGDITRVEWLSEGSLKGTVTYTYDNTGMLVKMNRDMIDPKSPDAHFCQVFEYEKFTR
ncbi:MAG: hypothetical protein SF052_02165 [Bacteroidia bacterium]|nr:hypothetical protein [Bacteroidia bacterium]